MATARSSTSSSDPGAESGLPGPLPRPVAIVCVGAFLVLIGLGPLLWLFGEPVKTRAAKPFPTWSTDAFLDGRWTENLRLHLRETSPVTVAFRGVGSELEYLLGVHEADVLVGRGGVMFAPFSVRPSFARVRNERDERLAFHRELAAWTAERGIGLLCVVVPDKVRLMPERLFEDGRLPEPKASAYAAFLAELEAGGIATIDLAREFAAARAERPEVSLYHERDTHWTAAGAWRAARAITDRLDELGWLADVPPAPIVATPAQVFAARADLASLCGFLTDGLFARRVADFGRSAGIRLARTGDPSQAVAPVQPTARIALCGDSFAGMLSWTLPAATGRLVDTAGAVPGQGPLAGLLDTLERIDRGELRPRVLVWELIERSQAEAFWTPRPQLP